MPERELAQGSMGSDEKILIERLKERLRDPKRFADLFYVYEVYPPVTPDELEQPAAPADAASAALRKVAGLGAIGRIRCTL